MFDVIKEHGLDSLTQKQVLRHAEAKLGLEEKALKGDKEKISGMIDEYIASQPKAEEAVEDKAPSPKASGAKRAAPTKTEDDDEVSDLDDDDEEEEKPAKKAKAEKTEKAEKADKTFLVTTASGEECPKKIKDLQKRVLTRNKFLSSAPDMEFELWGNKLLGKPRAFTSDNMGWYTGGKIEFEVGGKKVWGQIGVNLTIMGSKDWK